MLKYSCKTLFIKIKRTKCDNMKIFLTIAISFYLIGFNTVFAAKNKVKSIKNNNSINCYAEPLIKYIPIKGMENSSLLYAVLINHKEKKHQLISDKNNNVKCIFN